MLPHNERLRGLTLVSSNVDKLDEYRRMMIDGLVLGECPDLVEVDGTPEEVILHKAIAAGPGTIVEDTIITVQGRPHVDIKFKFGSLDSWVGLPATWEIRLGQNDGAVVRSYLGRVEGRIVSPRCVGFGFDPYFEVSRLGKTLAELDEIGQKDVVSARKLAIIALLKNSPDTEHVIRDVEPWTGDFQN